MMYAAYLSYDQLKGYLRILEDKEMIGLDERTGLHFIRQNGLKFIKPPTVKLHISGKLPARNDRTIIEKFTKN
jgi:Winged helix-turn-helix